MTRRALLIASQTHGLTGCDADVALMAEMLRTRGFAIDQRTGSDATRAGLIDGFEVLIGATRPGDAAVVYYSGHGGRLTRPDFEARKADGQTVHYQFLVPVDIDESNGDDFRGLLAEELTTFQRRLTDVFLVAGQGEANVTTILDCCHSGYMARDPSLVAKAIDAAARGLTVEGIAARLDTLAGSGRPSATGGSDTNPHAVRIVACQPEQSAYERDGARGRHGALTEALVDVLGEVGEGRVPWAVILDLVRQRVLATVPQRADVEGPAATIPFTGEQERRRDSLPVTLQRGEVQIEAAGPLGVAHGDRFRLTEVGNDQVVAEAVVDAITRGNARLAVTLAPGVGSLPVAVRALPLALHLARRRIEIDPAGGEQLRQAVDASSRLTTDPTAGPVFATVVQDGGWVVRDDAGARARVDVFPDDDRGRGAVVEVLETLALGRRMAELGSIDQPPESLLEAAVQVSFVRLDTGTPVEQASHGARLPVGARISVSVQNLSDAELFFWLFDVGVSGRIGLVTQAAPQGTRLGPKGSPDDVYTVWGAEGAPLAWPGDVPADGERPETLVLIVADRRQDLSPLDTSRARGAPRSALDLALGEVSRGAREVPAAGAGGTDGLRYRVERLELFVVPGP